MSKEKIDLEIKWNENVKEAKELFTGRNRNQMKMASLALEVCEITWGGGKKGNLFTIKRFAEEAGIAPKSLSEWICVRKNVYEKLSNEQKEDPTLTYTKLARIANRIDRTASKEELGTAYQEVVKSNSVEQIMSRYVYDIRSAANAFQNKDAASKCSDKLIEEVYFYCNVIIRNIRKSRPALHPAEHGIAGSSNIRNLNANQAFDMPRNHTGKVMVSDSGQKVSISPKDRLIVDLMKKKKGFLTPSEIQNTLGKYNPKHGTAWASRTLGKLHSLDLVERNKHGHYKWVG